MIYALRFFGKLTQITVRGVTARNTINLKIKIDGKTSTLKRCSLGGLLRWPQAPSLASGRDPLPTLSCCGCCRRRRRYQGCCCRQGGGGRWTGWPPAADPSPDGDAGSVCLPHLSHIHPRRGSHTHTATGTVNEACTYISFPQKAPGFFITCTAEEDDE